MAKYINVDKLIADLHTVNPIYKKEVDWATRVVEATPEADVRENVRGRWIVKEWHDGSFIQSVCCSECGEDFVNVISMIGHKPIWDFCPECGAMMEGNEYDI